MIHTCKTSILQFVPKDVHACCLVTKLLTVNCKNISGLTRKWSLFTTAPVVYGKHQSHKEKCYLLPKHRMLISFYWPWVWFKEDLGNSNIPVCISWRALFWFSKNATGAHGFFFFFFLFVRRYSNNSFTILLTQHMASMCQQQLSSKFKRNLKMFLVKRESALFSRVFS